MSDHINATVTLQTPYGPAGYEVVLAPDGRVLTVNSAVAKLPEAVFRISFGERWEDARAYFLLLSQNLPFQVEAALWLNDPPKHFKPLRKAFRARFPSELPTITATSADHLRRATFWLAHPTFLPALFLQKNTPRALAAMRRSLLDGLRPPTSVEAWLYSTIPLHDELLTLQHLYTVLALLDSPTARDYLFGELEREGRHPHASTLLLAITHFNTLADRQRILELRHWLADDAMMARRYLKLLHPYSDTEVHEVIIALLARHPEEAKHALEALQATKHPEPARVIREQFDREENYFLLDLIAELIAGAPPGIRVSLVEMNEKVATPRFTEGAQVTWPQMLEPNWSQLVLAEKAASFFPLVTEYLLRKEGRLQRNALLQLRVWLKQFSEAQALPQRIQDRLRELINSRYDKVSTVALDLIAQSIIYFEDQQAIITALIDHGLTSQYRLMVAAALRQAARIPRMKRLQIEYIRQLIGRANDQQQLGQLKRLIPYLKHLNLRTELTRLAQQREAVLNEDKGA